MGRSPGIDETGLKKGPWTPEEDQKLIKHIQEHGHASWRALPKLAGLNRCGKSCRLRWTNYLRPDIKRGKFSEDEEQTILHLHSILGNKWSAIATRLPGRTDNEIKNFWNTHLKKKLIQMGFDPMTHRPRTDIFSSLPHLIALANLKELIENSSLEEQVQRLQAEAVQTARLQYLQYLLQAPPSMANFSENMNTLSDMDNYNLLNSLSSMKDNPVCNSTTLQEFNDSIPFSHLPNLQIPPPCSFQTSVNKDMGQGSNFTELSHGKDSPSSPWFPSTLSPSPPPQAGPPVTVSSITKSGEACSTSSYGGTPPSFWPDFLLEDALFHDEIA
ncbi:unnamed protein product [Ilex paraguariensis]|uniref:Uncharacterized protein n=1 Tax=Ilex paraguariensis TaxID=185542 RepID=A0ABC8T700_9AQUA